VRDALAPLQQFPRLGPELAGRWEGFRFILGSWRWMLLVYVFDEDRDRVVVVTVQECENVDRCYRAVLPGVLYWCAAAWSGLDHGDTAPLPAHVMVDSLREQEGLWLTQSAAASTRRCSQPAKALGGR